MRFAAFKSILAAVVVTTGALSPQIGKAETALNVPFSFSVSGQTMPAGVYTVKQNALHTLVSLRNQNASKSFAYTLRPGDSSANQARVSLKFGASGGRHVLRGIQFGSKTTDRLDDGRAPAGYEPAGYEPGGLSQGR